MLKQLDEQTQSACQCGNGNDYKIIELVDEHKF